MLLCLPLLLLVGHKAEPNQEQSTGPDGGIFGDIEAGQPVALIDLGTAYELRLIEGDITTGKTISAVGRDWIAVRDEPGLVERTIPATAIRAIVRTRAPR
jgi:hypothetical protein